MIRGYRGPFAKQDRRGKSAAVVRIAVLCFPNGPPVPSTNWQISSDATIPMVQKLLRDLFRGNCTKPCLSRWYTVETFSWYCMGLAMHQLIFPIVGNCYLNYWPDTYPRGTDDADAETKKNESKKRSQLIAKYLNSDDFIDSLIICCVTSMPRWRLLRCTEQIPRDGEGKEERRIAKGLEKCLTESRRIISGEHILAERLISASRHPDFVRVRIWNSLLRSLMYLSYRNLPYCSTLWKILRGASIPSSIRSDLQLKPHCCEDPNMLKIRSNLLRSSPIEGEILLCDLEVMLETACEKYNAKGHCGNVEAEGRLRDCTTLTLRHPFRSVMFRTLQREHGIKFANAEQRNFYADFLARFFWITKYDEKENAIFL